jgi:uncharacterized protein (TIGR02453 family)
MAPPHFTEQALKFLRGLKRNNNREWFEPRKSTYETALKAPMLALLSAINDAMIDFAPDNVQPPHKAMMRIYRDVRFSADKTPYKPRVAAWWSRAGLEKTSGAGFYFSLNTTEITIAAGSYMPEREQLLAIRRHLSESGESAGAHHKELRALLANKKLKTKFEQFEGHRLTRPPKGFDPNDPAMDLLLCRQWGIAARLPAETATTPALFKEIVDRFRIAAPVVALLNQPLVGKPKKPLF